MGAVDCGLCLRILYTLIYAFHNRGNLPSLARVSSHEIYAPEECHSGADGTEHGIDRTCSFTMDHPHDQSVSSAQTIMVFPGLRESGPIRSWQYVPWILRAAVGSLAIY